MGYTLFRLKKDSWKISIFSRTSMGIANSENLFQALMLMVIAGIFAGLSAWIEQSGRIYDLNLDSWGDLINNLKNSGHDLAVLFQDPIMFRGPVIPFIFGLSYYIAPFEETVLVLNVIAFSLAVGILFMAFCYLGGNRVIGTITILLWLAYWYPLKGIFGYYFAEPVITLLSSVLFLTVGWLVIRPRPWIALISGGIAGLLLLSRAPFLFIIFCIPVILWFHLNPKGRKKIILLFTISFIFVFSPWTIRNLIVHGEFIPFTTGGGLVLFQGSYLKGDSKVITYLREIPEFQRIESESRKLSGIARNRYWKNLAWEQIKQNPLGQVRLVVRKALRFWVYLPAHSWIPTLRTSVMALIFFPLFCYGVVKCRNHILVHLCTVWFVGLWAFHAIVHSELRYNIPVMPMMFVLAVIGLFQLLTIWTRGQFVFGVLEFRYKPQNLGI